MNKTVFKLTCYLIQAWLVTVNAKRLLNKIINNVPQEQALL